MQQSSLWLNNSQHTISIIDQTRLPHAREELTLSSLEDAEKAIITMQVRGAPLIGVTAAFGLCFALRAGADDAQLQQAYQILLATRPTAVNLKWALDAMRAHLLSVSPAQRFEAAWEKANSIYAEEIDRCQKIGECGAELVGRLKRSGADNESKPLHIMTHCNTGWLATGQFGTALAVIYILHQQGIPVHVWVSETRPRNQGASLTAWELSQAGVPCTVVADNACGYLMQQGFVDVCIVGADRVTKNGDTANKIGTYLKALAAKAHNVPFYVALPFSTLDMTKETGKDIPIEERSAREVTHIFGTDTTGKNVEVRLTPEGVKAINPGFDVTPGELVTGFVTEKGLLQAPF